MTLPGRRKVRLPAGEGLLTRLSRLEAVLEDIKAGGSVSMVRVNRELVLYHQLLRSLWLWGFIKK
ncbi:hypothetical protein ES703_90048 [subsurface metagenome]